MQRHPQTSSPAPLHLRRSHARHQEQPFQQPSFTFGGTGPSHFREMPDLSVHLPPRHSSNRFEVLALLTPPQETEAIKEYHAPARYRRSRNSRGTKEAKRRRDARRSRRKMAAQMLDDQLSREIDFALSNINGLPTPPSSVQSPAPVESSNTYMPRWLTDLPALPPSPPQLPALDFRSFSVNVNSFLEANAAGGSPSPLPSLTPTISLPSWCPPLPCFTRKGIWSEGLPTFYDLSSMPEPKQHSKPERDPNLCKELQLWHGSLDIKPKQSRFFPASPLTTKPTVKLAPTACKLHVSEMIPLDVSLDRPTSYADAVKKGLENAPARTEDEEVIETPIDVNHSTHMREPSAANLWNILAEVSTKQETVYDPYMANFEASHDNDSYLAAWQTHLDMLEQGDLPAELDGREIPYVHANSLIGHSNEASMSPYAIEHPNMVDSAVCFTPLASPPLGLNELMVDYDIGPPLVTARRYSGSDEYHDRVTKNETHSLVLADILPVDCIKDDEDGGEEALSTSDAHFQSEQSLFSLGTPPPAQPRAVSMIDIATFLKMGHARNCWCQECETEVEMPAEPSQPASDTDMAMPELLMSPVTSTKDMETPELVPFDKLTELDDDWMLYSATDDQSSTIDNLSSPVSPLATCETRQDYERNARMTCCSPPVWDDFFPCKPHATCTVQPMRQQDEVRYGGTNDFDWE